MESSDPTAEYSWSERHCYLCKTLARRFWKNSCQWKGKTTRWWSSICFWCPKINVAHPCSPTSWDKTNQCRISEHPPRSVARMGKTRCNWKFWPAQKLSGEQIERIWVSRACIFPSTIWNNHAIDRFCGGYRNPSIYGKDKPRFYLQLLSFWCSLFNSQYGPK